MYNMDITKLVYVAYVQSVMQYGYGIRVWGGAFNSHINKLFIIQKHTIKTATDKLGFSLLKNSLNNLMV